MLRLIVQVFAQKANIVNLNKKVLQLLNAHGYTSNQCDSSIA